MRRLKKVLVALIISGGLFVAANIIYSIELVISLVSSACVFSGLVMLLPTKKDDTKKLTGGKSKPQITTENENEFVCDGITRGQLNSIIADGKKKVDTIRSFKSTIKNPIVIADINEICIIAESIFDDFKKDPKDIKGARKFLSYYLDATVKIVAKYSELANSMSVSDSSREVLSRTEANLKKIRDTFDEQLEKLLHDDFFDLNIELEVLEKTIKSEGVK